MCFFLSVEKAMSQVKGLNSSGWCVSWLWVFQSPGYSVVSAAFVTSWAKLDQTPMPLQKNLTRPTLLGTMPTPSTQTSATKFSTAMLASAPASSASLRWDPRAPPICRPPSLTPRPAWPPPRLGASASHRHMRRQCGNLLSNNMGDNIISNGLIFTQTCCCR